MIIGADLMWNMGIDIQYSEEQIHWDDEYIPMKTRGALMEREYCKMLYAMHTDTPLLKEMEERQSRLLDCDYSKVDIKKMVDELYISRDSKRRLRATLEKFPELFGGGLGKLKGVKPVHITLTPGAKAYASSYYNIPKSMEQAAKTEVNRMCKIDVLERLHWYDDSPWAAPTFGVPKKTGNIRIVTDFWKMNMQIQQQPFPLPRIIETIQRLEKFTSTTALDLSLPSRSVRKVRRYVRLSFLGASIPISVCRWGYTNPPHLFQSIMQEVCGDLEYVLVYINDILIIQREGESEADHLAKIKIVFQRLQDAGFRANLRKSFFMQKEIEYLGYQLTSKGLECQPKK